MSQNVMVRTHYFVAEAAEYNVFFKIAPVKIYNEGQVQKTYALIDEGSNVSLINQDLAEHLQLKGPKRRLNLQW